MSVSKKICLMHERKLGIKKTLQPYLKKRNPVNGDMLTGISNSIGLFN